MNNVSLIGRLTRDPEVVDIKSDTNITILRVAINGRKKDDTTYVDVKTFNGTANAAAEYLDSGQEVAVSGRLTTDEWTDRETGKKRSRLYVIANEVDFGRKAAAKDEASEPDPEPQEAAA